jgi:hypothetical protein
VKAADASRQSTISGCVWFGGALGIRLARGNLILDDSDVSGGRSREYIPFGGLSQVFELAFLPSSPQRTAPRRRYIPLSHGPPA